MKFLLIYGWLVSSLFLLPGGSQGQVCIPNTNYTVQGIYPDTLSTGYPDSAYLSVIDIKIPPDTTIGPIYAIIDSLEILEVFGLPTGFQYECNISRCAWLGGDNGCVRITGSPDASQIGVYPLKVMINTYLDIAGTPATQLDSNVSYAVVIEDPLAGMPATVKVISLETKVSPNPFRSDARISYRLPGISSQPVSLVLYDMLGRSFHPEYSLSGQGNYQTIILSGTDLDAGMYSFRLIFNDPEVSAVGRLIIQ